VAVPKIYNMKQFQITCGIEKDRNGSSIDKLHIEKCIQAIKHRLCTRFGGYTMTRSFGGWVNDGVLVEEEGVVFTVLYDGIAAPENITFVAEFIRDLLDQQCVVLYFDGEAKFV
jgi:hypothetical protein